MVTWCVYHLIHVRTPYQYLPKLVIREVPNEDIVTEDLVERAGFRFGEFNISWANHELCRVDAKESPSDLVARIRSGEGEKISYVDLVKFAEAPL